MTLGSNRDYKSRDARIKISMKVHEIRMEHWISEGLSKKEASARAYKEFKEGKLGDLIKKVKEEKN